MNEHEHGWTALAWNFGPYGPQDVHVHSCYEGKCQREYVGAGRNCAKGAPHTEVRLPLTEKREQKMRALLTPPPETEDSDSMENGT